MPPAEGEEKVPYGMGKYVGEHAKRKKGNKTLMDGHRNDAAKTPGGFRCEGCGKTSCGRKMMRHHVEDCDEFHRILHARGVINMAAPNWKDAVGWADEVRRLRTPGEPATWPSNDDDASEEAVEPDERTAAPPSVETPAASDAVANQNNNSGVLPSTPASQTPVPALKKRGRPRASTTNPTTNQTDNMTRSRASINNKSPVKATRYQEVVQPDTPYRAFVSSATPYYHPPVDVYDDRDQIQLEFDSTSAAFSPFPARSTPLQRAAMVLPDFTYMPQDMAKMKVQSFAPIYPKIEPKIIASHDRQQASSLPAPLVIPDMAPAVMKRNASQIDNQDEDEKTLATKFSQTPPAKKMRNLGTFGKHDARHALVKQQTATSHRSYTGLGIPTSGLDEDLRKMAMSRSMAEHGRPIHPNKALESDHRQVSAKKHADHEEALQDRLENNRKRAHTAFMDARANLDGKEQALFIQKQQASSEERHTSSKHPYFAGAVSTDMASYADSGRAKDEHAGLAQKRSDRAAS